MAKKTGTDEAAVTAEAAQATEAAQAAAVPGPYDMVEMFAPVPSSDNEDANIVIYVNGKNWVIPKDGGHHQVPRCVRAEYERSQRAVIAARNNKNKRAMREQDINARTAALIGGGNI